MSWCRSAVWFVKGLREYTRTSYESASKHFNPADVEVDVAGRSFLVTGANSGIGKATAKEIARRGTYILTTALLPLLEKEADARVITVSSGGMLVQKLNLSDLQSENGTFDGTMVYAQNKRQQVVLTEQWAKACRNIHFSVMHPGWADTPAVRSSMPDFYQKMKNTLRTEAQGADTVVWLAVFEATKLLSGLFFQDRQPVPTHLPLASTHSPPEDEEKLMEVLEELSQKFKSTSPGT
ncbi:dehydrogenase/reductase SDR family member 12-like [Falco biarmicus]|uniref:dehydrogenase/reductase SDR family member 12-like n=1 Tax=Falco cherrug TaxID=345164 RepID=UPI002479747C|nr:dehydrogenase/reductase SDR family member 12-like [Falco cherrug]XP_056179600.1 dehydrogenase/reductase SDR family member 12-like [Falco biarmicus]